MYCAECHFFLAFLFCFPALCVGGKFSSMFSHGKIHLRYIFFNVYKNIFPHPACVGGNTFLYTTSFEEGKLGSEVPQLNFVVLSPWWKKKDSLGGKFKSRRFLERRKFLKDESLVVAFAKKMYLLKLFKAYTYNVAFVFLIFDIKEPFATMTVDTVFVTLPSCFYSRHACYNVSFPHC